MPTCLGARTKERRRSLRPGPDNDSESGFATEQVANYPAILCKDRKYIKDKAEESIENLACGPGQKSWKETKRLNTVPLRRSTEELEAATNVINIE